VIHLKTFESARWSVLTVALLFAASLCSQISLAQRRSSDAVTVALTPDACASVSDGDALTLDWNPAFEHPGIVLGLRQFELSFVRPVNRSRVARTGAPIHLIANPRMHGEFPGQAKSEIETLSNGYFRMRFHLRLAYVEPGEYQLFDAQVVPFVSADYLGDAPRMTNTPMSLPFCLNVVAPAESRRANPLR
jgi:hypothetical protein